MKLSVKAFGIAGAIAWGGGVFLIGLGNLISETYGVAFLEVIASIYPGYTVDGDFGSVIVATLYAALDGAIVGFVFAWLYNRFAGNAAA